MEENSVRGYNIFKVECSAMETANVGITQKPIDIWFNTMYCCYERDDNLKRSRLFDLPRGLSIELIAVEWHRDKKYAFRSMFSHATKLADGGVAVISDHQCSADELSDIKSRIKSRAEEQHNYYLNHIDTLREKKREYYQKNKPAKPVAIVCECGAKITEKSRNKHLLTKKHAAGIRPTPKPTQT